MEHKVEIGGKEYVFKRATLGLEIEVEELKEGLIEALKVMRDPGGKEKIRDLWQKVVALVIVDPDEAVADALSVTQGEMIDLFLSFREAAQTFNVKPTNG